VSQLRITVAVLFATLGLWCVLQGGWIHIKALVAQRLLERAWSQALAGGDVLEPWPWADTQPVGRLRVRAQDVDLVVLAGATGRTLAFAPGRVAGSPPPGEPGTAIIAGHRDTHFAFLRSIEIDQRIDMVDTSGREYRYRVVDRSVVHERVAIEPEFWGNPALVLVTCYPFDTPVPGQ
jgi:sortase A